ncbi:hypothetical protein GETHLI_21180 [Geothrix limicola]|uniref:Uncharacterized protein n=1 Tax=Geothrix limicola TaxID=2927978 RepID=A0ABQ5QGZ8_9BACT|nr:hypothetical protein [Geothrix limicola]GLH73616.1 hypothetical protein GETHLI_21180 [Geothrix limicola]
MAIPMKLRTVSGGCSLVCLSAVFPMPLAGGVFPEAASSKAFAQPGAAARTLVLASPPKTLFPKLIELLLDRDYIILSANQDLGLISFRHQKEDKSIRSRRHVNVVEGTLLLQDASPTSARVRVKLTQSWQESSFNTHHETGVQADADPGYYQSFFKMLEDTFPVVKP